MKTLDSNLPCPSCSLPMQARSLACDPCGVRVEGRFESNEFARLGAEDLNLLRIFIHCEGRIRDMESVLGLSYPTIKSRIGGLKAKLIQIAAPPPPPEPASATDIIRRLEEGSLSFEDAMNQLKGMKK